jgi:hypothetical protein
MLTVVPPAHCAPIPYSFLFQVPTWPTAYQLTYEVAARGCRTEIQAELSASMCGNMIAGELTTAIDTCVEDLQVNIYRY